MQQQNRRWRIGPPVRRNSRALLAVALAAVAALLFAASSGGFSTSATTGKDGTIVSGANGGGTPKSGGTLVIGRAYDPVNLNPFTCACENPSLQTMVQIFGTLVRYAPDATKPPLPSLATSWKISSDNLTYTFTLRDAKFSDGSPVTAKDVIYSLKRAGGPDSLYGLLYPIASVTSPDKSTVVVKLKHVTPAFLYSLGFVASSIVPAKRLEKLGNAKFSEAPVGSGAFMLKKWVKGQFVELVRNPYYWRTGHPYLDSVVLKYIPNDNTRSLAFQSGSVDIGDEIPYSQIDRLNSSGKGTVIVQPSSSVFAVQINNAVKPLNDGKVRQALAYATPTSNIKNVVFKGLPPIANSSAPKLKYWTDAVQPYTYDVAKAKQLLKAAGRPNGFTIKLAYTGTDDASRQTAQILQQAWGKIGVKVVIQEFDLNTVYSRMQSGNYEASMFLPDANTSDIPVPDEYAYFLYGSLKETKNLYSRYVNPAANNLVQQAITTADDAKRARLFAQIQKVTLKDPPNIPMTFAQYRAAVGSKVRGFAYELTGWYYLDDVWLNK
jgi:peptide/nickel transport system substrate-binding protein